MSKIKLIGLLIFSTVLLGACSISYKLNNATLDYTKVKTITISDFPNQAPLVFPALSQMFTEAVKDKFIKQTRLQMATNNGDLSFEGEITDYRLTPMAVKEDAISSQTRLTMTVRIRYSNRSKPTDDFEQTFSAYEDFDSNTNLTTVQDELCRLLVEKLTDDIYNATVGNW